MPTINDAISAYRTAVQRSAAFGRDDQADAAAQSSNASGSSSFGSMVKQAIASTVDTMKSSEQVSQAAVLGKADITQVAQAVNNADVTLQSVVAIRDKVVAAYQQILNMPI